MDIHSLPTIKGGLERLSEKTKRSIGTYQGYIANVLEYEYGRREKIIASANAYYHHGVDWVDWQAEDREALRRTEWRDELVSKMGWRYVKIERSMKSLQLSAPLAVLNTGAFAQFQLAGTRLDIPPFYYLEAPEGIQWWTTGQRVVFGFAGDTARRCVTSWYESCYHNPDWIAAITKRGKVPHDYLEPVPWAA